jgi:GWxTD domain-containing protein
LRKLSLIFLLVAATSAFAADDVMKWNKTPEAYYMTPAEREAWKKVASPDDARKFVDEFRRKRGEQFLKDIRTRIDRADADFKLDKTPGSLTQRGRVWILLGSPSRSTTNRDIEDSRASAPGDVFHKLPLSGRGLIQSSWVYDADRLKTELGMKSLTVKFQTDYGRGYETIENPGFVEPYLTRVAEFVSNQYIADAQKQTAQRAVLPSPGSIAVAGPDPLWNATPALNGASFTGDSYISPTEEPFYAYSFYVPKSAPSFGDWKSALLVTLVKDASGQQIVANREPADISAYDELGNRYVDRSVALAPGKYEGLFAVYTPDGATLLASHKAAFEVAPKDATRASSLLLTSRVDTLPAQQALDPFTFVATKYAVRGDRRFLPTDKLAFFTVIANPAGSPNPKLMQKMTFQLDGKDFARTPLEPAQVTQTGPNTFLIGTAFDPDTFKPGHYTLEVQVRDMNAPEGSELRTKGWVLKNEFDVVR